MLPVCAAAIESHAYASVVLRFLLDAGTGRRGRKLVGVGSAGLYFPDLLFPPHHAAAAAAEAVEGDAGEPEDR